MEGDWLLEIPHSPVPQEAEGSFFMVSEGPSSPLPAPSAPADSGGQRRAREREEEAGPVGGGNHSRWLCCVLSWGCVTWGVNQRTQTHCLGVFILKAVSIVLKLSNKIKEAAKNIF